MIDMKLLGRRLHLSRLDLSLQQKELAVIAGISSSYLSELEKGRAKNVTMKRLSPLAKALNVSVAYLLGETPDPLLGQHDDPADDASLLREESAPYTVRRASAEERIIWVLHMLEPAQVEEIAQAMAHYMALPADQRQAVDRQIESLSFLVRTLHAAYVPLYPQWRRRAYVAIDAWS